jgi:hypothetical protein
MAQLQLNFGRGEITPLLHARIDLDQYQAGLHTMRGWIPLRYGGMTRCPGSVLRGFAKTPSKKFRFLPFQFNRAQCYALEVGESYIRFWNNTTKAQVESPPGTPYEIVSPYLEADLPYLQVRQSGDLVFIACIGYWPRVLTRTSETSWALALYVPLDGPYLDLNTTATTLDPSAASGAVTITASSITGINGGTGFQTTDVGRSIRYFDGARWFWFVITARTSTTLVSATFMGRDDGDTAAMAGHAATVNWRLGAWSDYEGYPSSVGQYEERLVWAATERQPTTVWATVAQDNALDDFSFVSPLVADDSVTARLTGALNSINWIADGKDILLGTEGAIRRLGRNDESAAFGPTNLRQKPETEVSTSYIPGFFIQNALLFLDVYRSKLYEALYQNEEQGYVPREISALNEHLIAKGVTSLAFQASPHGIIWATTEDGLLLAAVYDRDQQSFGVSQNPLGGTGTVVEWVMTLPGSDGDGDNVWLAVQRFIDGAVVRTVETLSAFYREGYSVQTMPIYGHCASVYDDVAVTEITGLEDFEGETYGVWADGVDIGDAEITDGVLTLPNGFEAGTVVWGYRQSSLARTLRPMDVGVGEQVVGRPAIVGDATIDVYQTGFLRVGAGEKDENDYQNGLDPVRWEDRTEYNPYEQAPLRTQSHTQGVDDSWANNGVLVLESNSMLPATVLAIHVQVEGRDS